MIEELRPGDLEPVLEIWLHANLEAHHFIDGAYWRGQLPAVREVLPGAQVWVAKQDGCPTGFIGLSADGFVAGLFVAQQARCRGTGAALLAHAKRLYPALRLQVYARNYRAVNFYFREGFVATGVRWDDAVREWEYGMRWQRP